MFRLLIGLLLVVLIAWAIRIWQKSRPVLKKEGELEEIKVEAKVLDFEEDISKERKNIRRRRSKLTAPQKREAE